MYSLLLSLKGNETNSHWLHVIQCITESVQIIAWLWARDMLLSKLSMTLIQHSPALMGVIWGGKYNYQFGISLRKFKCILKMLDILILFSYECTGKKVVNLHIYKHRFIGHEIHNVVNCILEWKGADSVITPKYNTYISCILLLLNNCVKFVEILVTYVTYLTAVNMASIT